jgi:hypothetical protein
MADVNNPVAGIPVTVTRLDGLLDEGKLQSELPSDVASDHQGVYHYLP